MKTPRPSGATERGTTSGSKRGQRETELAHISARTGQGAANGRAMVAADLWGSATGVGVDARGWADRRLRAPGSDSEDGRPTETTHLRGGRSRQWWRRRPTAAPVPPQAACLPVASATRQREDLSERGFAAMIRPCAAARAAGGSGVADVRRREIGKVPPATGSAVCIATGAIVRRSGSEGGTIHAVVPAS